MASLLLSMVPLTPGPMGALVSLQRWPSSFRSTLPVKLHVGDDNDVTDVDVTDVNGIVTDDNDVAVIDEACVSSAL